MAEFIGIENLTHIADQFTPQVIMGAAYYNPNELDRLGIKVISGIQFKRTEVVLNRKGGTTRRKTPGKVPESKIGYLEERVLTTYQTVNKYRDNQDNYRETPYQVEGSAEYSYPLSTEAFNAITMSYGEDVFFPLWFGDASLADKEQATPNELRLSLYDGFHTLVKKDMESGRISKARGNLIECKPIVAPTDTTDTAAYDHFMDWWAEWNTALRNHDVLVYMSLEQGMAIANAYANKTFGHTKVTYLPGEDGGKPSGNFTIMELPHVTFAPTADFGKGTLMYVTTPENFQYGVNSLDSKNFIKIFVGDPTTDLTDVIFQIQSIQGCRVLNVNPSNFLTNGGDIELEDGQKAGDYQLDNFLVSVNDDQLGSVTVNGTAPDPTKEYAPNTKLVLKATAKGSNKFVKWTNGATEVEITVYTKSGPGAIGAIFSKSE